MTKAEWESSAVELTEVVLEEEAARLAAQGASAAPADASDDT